MSSPRQKGAVLALAAAALLCGLLWGLLGGGPEEPRVEARAEDAPVAAARAAATLQAPAHEPSADEVAPRGSEPPAKPAPEDAAAAGTPRRAAAATPAVLVRGRVVDDTGAGLPGCTLESVVRSDGAPGEARAVRTDEDGRFGLRLPARGSLTVAVTACPPGWIVRDDRRERALLADAAPADLLFQAERWPPEPAGDVSGRLLSERGPWRESPLATAGSITLDLVSTSTPRIVRQARAVARADEEGTWSVSFRFADVPRGEYELTLSDLSHFRWSPARLFVAPPAERLEFTRLDGDRAVRLLFRVTDAETGAPVADWEALRVHQSASAESGVLMHVGPLELEGFPIDSRLDWVVRADGFAAAYGDERAFREETRDLWVADVALAKGWSTRFVVIGRDPYMRPLPGADVYLDGEHVGRTDDTGGLDVFREEVPRELHIAYPGFDVEGDPLARADASRTTSRGQVTMVQMVRRP